MKHLREELVGLFHRCLLEPVESRLLYDAARGRVLSGPFAGMRYVPRSFGSAFIPKLLGTYEMELQTLIEQLCSKESDTFVNVGGGEGYYSVGIAWRCPQIHVITFESSKKGRQLISRMAELNHVERRIEVRGHCDPVSLRDALAQGTERFLMMDVEGAELSLLEPKTIPELGNCEVLVEVHDYIHEGLSEIIRARFRDAGSIRKIDYRVRSARENTFPSIVPNRWRVPVMSEHRKPLQTWLHISKDL